MTDKDRREMIAAIQDPAFSHSRAGDRLYRGYTLIYHHCPTSPSGVHLSGAYPSDTADPLIREFRSTSPLSPTEPR